MTSTVAGVAFPITTPGLRKPMVRRAAATERSFPEACQSYAALGDFDIMLKDPESSKASSVMALKYHEAWHAPAPMPGLRHPLLGYSSDALPSRDVQTHTGLSSPGIRHPMIRSTPPCVQTESLDSLLYEAALTTLRARSDSTSSSDGDSCSIPPGSPPGLRHSIL
eukprot:TRINITY_DN109076_c0_g1_i1.p1 TRINITY_DN109076_c0_g1~~TRINITY_DN109076_c0_g1_i1.p1  ORF type:complete len:166 (-),score=18.64 TRINITY_DN109076_c0_g1_i1:40-537(-)